MKNTCAEVSAAWMESGTNGVALLLTIAPRQASSLVSNLRRTYPDLFPRRAKGRPRTHKQWRIRKAIELIQQGFPECAIPFLQDCLKPAKALKP